MLTLNKFKAIADEIHEQDQEMPVLFVGHGSPMNALEDNEFTRTWMTLGKSLPKPKAILCISAHWETKGSFVTAMEKPKTIHDFGGFPKALFDFQYNAAGSQWLAAQTQSTVHSAAIGLDNAWGLDHGCWSILSRLYPAADIPVVQLSLDQTKPAQYHYDLARELSGLRKKGVLIVGSGNVIHNFRYLNMNATKQNPMSLDWAIEANREFKALVIDRNHRELINYTKHNRAFQLAAPTPEHYLPMLYAIALAGKDEKVTFFNDAIVASSISMTSLKIG
ncbi:4,5-DOPA-extradiol-dioxygenase [Schlesneria paludicola]|uniref:4,5-DOPA-extradiol-dioxygenase n=1 Tax=Schlesneria paludicola TaxID=360056 RepID=UPI001ED95625|nr:4,5-DOPA dioxygenase extradiol [Schlesneria paludicola]